ncbi:MAG: GtrA family protein [Clostridiales bacterium]|nr:GtrA family protein [Clostridiales bacterium]
MKKDFKSSETWQVIKFTLFSISAGIIQIVSYALLFDVLHLSNTVSYLISLVLSVVWNFTFNRRYTFRSDANIPKAMALVALYYLVFTPLSTWLDASLVTAGWHEYLVLAICMILNFITEFLFQRFVVYRDNIDTNDIAKRAKENA